MAELEINNNEDLQKQLKNIVNDPSINKPSEEEVVQAQKEFEEAAKEWSTTNYQIGKPEEAQEICDYLNHFLRNRFLWQKDAWMGVIRLTDELKSAEVSFKGKTDKSLELGYQALEFTYYVLSNPGGIGLQAALDFESEHEIFIKTALAVESQLESARKRLKEVEFLQQRWGAMAQGFYLELEPELDSELNSETNLDDEEDSVEVDGKTGEPLS